MNKIKDFVVKYPIIDLLVICTIIIVCSCLFCNHFTYLFSDRGREYLFSEEILNGKVPYKDILMIYFPTSYYINALIYKVLGISITSLNITQTIFCIFFMFLYYFLARIFLDRKASILLSLLVISCCIFSYDDLFAYISPYSYGRAYGMMSFVLCVFLLIKLFKTDNLIYVYLASLTAGFSFICKFEFFIAYLMLIIALCFYKKLTLSQYLKIFLLCTVFPVILISVLLIQGVSIDEMTSAAIFGFKFSKTPVMTLFLSKSGMYPTLPIWRLKFITKYTPYFVTLVLLCFVAQKLSIKYSKQWIILLITLYIWRFFFDVFAVMHYWVLLPVVLLIVLCCKFKELYKEDLAFLILFIGALLGAQRCFFLHSVGDYGIYSFPLLILCTYILIKKFLPAAISGVNTKTLVNYIVMVLTVLYFLNLYAKNIKNYLPLITDKGTIYLDFYMHDIFSKTLTYIDYKTDKNSSILVLPEGHILNFLTNRKTNLRCHMMDRLYHDTFGPKKARDLIAWADTDYIILIKKAKLHDFFYPYLYNSNDNPSRKYIYNHYKVVEKYENKLGRIIILKKKD